MNRNTATAASKATADFHLKQMEFHKNRLEKLDAEMQEHREALDFHGDQYEEHAHVEGRHELQDQIDEFNKTANQVENLLSQLFMQALTR